MSVPPPNQQISIIRNLVKTTELNTDESAYLISLSWFNNWKIAIGYENFQPRNMEIKEIDNSNLLYKGELRGNIIENADFVILTEPVWEKLYSWYGGGPELKVDVLFDPDEKKCIACVHSIEVQVYYKDERIPFKFSIYHNIGYIKGVVCKKFNCDPNKSRLCDFEGKVRNSALDESKNLKQSSIIDNYHLLLLESQRDDGTWITVTHRKIQSNTMVNSPSIQTIVSSAAEPGVCGLANVGNSCYINAALQALTHTPAIYDLFLKNSQWIANINPNNKKGSENNVVIHDFDQLMNDMWSGNNNKISNTPKTLKFHIGKKYHQFGDQSQQDSHEFLMALMDILHEDMNKANPTGLLDPVFGHGTNDEEIAKLSWERHKKINDSFIVDNFHGLLRSRLVCPICKKITIVFDPFMSLTVPLPIPRTLSPKFIFVPYDLTQPRVEMQLSVVSPATLPEYIEEISQRIHRPINDLVFAERPPNVTILSWRSTVSTQAPCFAFEIPPHDESSVFTCARLVAPKDINGTPVVTELDGIFLVEIPREDATPEEVNEACQKRFAPFWKPTPDSWFETTTQENQMNEKQHHDSENESNNEKEVNDNDENENEDNENSDFGSEEENIKETLNEFRKKLCKDPKVNFNENENMKARPVIHPLNKYGFMRERHMRSISSTLIEILLNPDVIRDTNKFDWSLLRKKIVNSKELEIEKRKKVTLDECLKIFQNDDVLDANNKWYCPHCHQFVCANKKMDIWETPEYLIIHLKRFMHTASSHLKLDINVKYPNVLDMNPYIIGPKKDEENKYSLYAVIEHSGSLGGGHYTAHAYNHIKKKWYFFNDDVVKGSRPTAAHNKEGYVLFYAKFHEPIRRIPKDKKTETIIVTEEMKKQLFIPRIVLPVLDLNQKVQRRSVTKPAQKQNQPQTSQKDESSKHFDKETMMNNILRTQAHPSENQK